MQGTWKKISQTLFLKDDVFVLAVDPRGLGLPPALCHVGWKGGRRQRQEGTMGWKHCSDIRGLLWHWACRGWEALVLGFWLTAKFPNFSHTCQKKNPSGNKWSMTIFRKTSACTDKITGVLIKWAYSRAWDLVLWELLWRRHVPGLWEATEEQ